MIFRDFSIYSMHVYCTLQSLVVNKPRLANERKILPQLLGNKFIDCITTGNGMVSGVRVQMNQTEPAQTFLLFFSFSFIPSVDGEICKFKSDFVVGCLQMGCNFSGCIVDFWLVSNYSSSLLRFSLPVR